MTNMSKWTQNCRKLGGANTFKLHYTWMTGPQVSQQHIGQNISITSRFSAESDHQPFLPSMSCPSTSLGHPWSCCELTGPPPTDHYYHWDIPPLGNPTRPGDALMQSSSHHNLTPFWQLSFRSRLIFSKFSPPIGSCYCNKIILAGMDVIYFTCQWF